MPRIIVCPLSQVPTSVSTYGASHLVTLIKDGTRVQRPDSIPAERHLFLSFDDILEPKEGLTAPSEEHASSLLTFVQTWNREKPMVIHCYAGISRSTAAAFITMCAIRPERAERDIALSIRTASPFATPNLRLVSFADRLLAREGRMISAVESIGRGEDAFEGIPFALPVMDETG